MTSKTALNLIESEFNRAENLYPKFHSNHEGYAVILEEVEELWEEIKKSKDTRGNKEMEHELIQVGAMVVRYLENLC